MSDELLFGEPDQIDEVVTLLRRHPRWPADPLKDRKIAALLIQQYGSTLDLSDEIAKWTGHKLGRPTSKKKENLSAQVTNWCSNAERFARERASRRHGGSQPRHGAAAGDPRAPRAGGRPGDFSGVTSGRGSW